MEELIKFVTNEIQTLSSNYLVLSIFLGMFLVVLESILPFLPLAVFIAINVIAFGNVGGFILSYVSTIMGCTLSFYLVRRLRKYNHYKNVEKLVDKFENLGFTNLVILTAVPFTPAFSINIAAGLSKMRYKKFLFILLIAKISTIYFWGFIGTTFIESITDITVMIKLGVILIITFILSKIVIKKFDIC